VPRTEEERPKAERATAQGDATICQRSPKATACEEKILLIPKELLTVVLVAGFLTPSAVAAQSEEVKPAQDQILGSRAAREVDRPEFLWLERGAEIRQSPEWESQVIAIVDIRVQVAIAQEQGDWLLVRYAGWKGWVHRTGERESEDIVPFSTAPDPEMLGRVMEMLGQGPEPVRTLGPFALYTDVSEKRLLGFLDKVAADLPRAYVSRYGLDPGAETLEAIVLFSHDEDYRTFARTTTDAPGLPTGHATQGIAVVSVGEQPRDEVAAILVHELTHLLNRKVFREIELPWLDEGMANDLAYCQIKRWSGALDLGTLGGRSVVIDRPVYLAGGESRVDREVRLEGAVASLSLLRESRSLLPLDLLLDLQPAEFMDPIDLRTRYDQSTFFIRYLLDSGDSALAASFREYLQLLAEGHESDQIIDLPTHLGLGSEELGSSFEDWLRE
jgi:hypothetical protein